MLLRDDKKNWSCCFCSLLIHILGNSEQGKIELIEKNYTTWAIHIKWVYLCSNIYGCVYLLWNVNLIKWTFYASSFIAMELNIFTTTLCSALISIYKCRYKLLQNYVFIIVTPLSMFEIRLLFLWIVFRRVTLVEKRCSRWRHFKSDASNYWSHKPVITYLWQNRDIIPPLIF